MTKQEIIDVIAGFVTSVLSGEGWILYKQQTDEQIASKYKERITNERC